MWFLVRDDCTNRFRLKENFAVCFDLSISQYYSFDIWCTLANHCVTSMSLGFVQVKSKFWCITCTFQSAFECVKIAFARAQALLFLDELFALETALDQRKIRDVRNIVHNKFDKGCF